MGKSIIIKGADFSQNALQEVVLPKVTMNAEVAVSGSTSRAWGPYIENESVAVGAKLFLPSASESSLSNYELYVVEIGTTGAGAQLPGTMIATGNLPEERSEQFIYFNNPVQVGGNTQIVMRGPVFSAFKATDPTYIEDGWQYYTTYSAGRVVEKKSNPLTGINKYFRHGISLIIEM